MVHRVTQLIAAPHPRLSTSPVLLASPHSILPQGHIRYRACHFVRVCLFHGSLCIHWCKDSSSFCTWSRICLIVGAQETFGERKERSACMRGVGGQPHPGQPCLTPGCSPNSPPFSNELRGSWGRELARLRIPPPSGTAHQRRPGPAGPSG